MLGLRIVNRANATVIAEQLGMSRNAVYAARYRWTHGFLDRPSQLKRGPLRIEYVYSTNEAQPRQA